MTLSPSNPFFAWPQAAYYGRVVPKQKIYDHARASSRLKDLFVEQVDKITWAYKLAPETINVTGTKSVSEIQVFEVRLKEADLHPDILKAIDKAIPFPLVFELVFDGRRQLVATYKRPNEADKSKWVIGEHLMSDWLDEPEMRVTLPVSLNLSALYEKLLEPLVPEEVQSEEPMQIRMERLEQIRLQRREVDKIETRLTKEKQFKKKVAINAELRAARQKLGDLENMNDNKSPRKAM